MSTINTSVLLGHADSQVNLSAAATETVDGKEFTILSLEVDTTDYEIAPSIITTQRAAILKVQSGDDVLIGIDGSAYPFRVKVDGGQLFRFNTEGYTEQSTVTAIADVASSLSSLYFDLTDRTGAVRVWFNMGGAAPATPGGGRLLPVVVVPDSAATVVAAAIAAAIDADSEFDATAADAVVTVTDQHTGTRSIIHAGTSGMAVARLQAGAVLPSIHIKSVGSSQVTLAVVPK